MAAEPTMEESKVELNNKPMTYETIYAGSIHLINTDSSAKHPHQCILFLSTSKDQLIPPKTVESVTYQMHPTSDNKQGWKKSFKDSPFFWSINVYGTFEWLIIVDFKSNTEPNPSFNKSNFVSDNCSYTHKQQQNIQKFT